MKIKFYQSFLLSIVFGVARLKNSHNNGRVAQLVERRNNIFCQKDFQQLFKCLLSRVS